MSTIFLYTGQGAQFEGMGTPFMDSPKTRILCTMASDISGIDVEKLLTQGSAETLKQTKQTQIAIATVQAMTALLLKERGIVAEGVAGFSLGEIAAYWDAGIFSTEEFFQIITIRGSLMEQYNQEIVNRYGEPGMAAVMGMEKDQILATIEPIDQVYGANYNSPKQTVIAGTQEAIAKAAEALKAAGARRVLPLKVSGPFHTPLMAPAAEAIAEAIAEKSFQDPKKPVYANATALQISSGEEAKSLLITQLTSPVRWVEIEESIMANLKPTTVLEVGPGKVLAGLWKGITSSVNAQSIGTPESVQALEL